LPSNRSVEVEISYYPHIHYKQEELIFGCEGSLNEKPLPTERFTRYVSAGQNRWRPGEDETDYIGRTGFYHIRRSAPRNVGSCYTVGYIVRTQKAGTYKAIVSFLTDEIEGNSFLTITVSDKATGRLRCHVKEHGGCYVKPYFGARTGTEIAGRYIEMHGGPRSVVTFSAGRAGPQEAGDWEFWTAVRGTDRYVIRCRAGADPGERFRQMEGVPAYQGPWEIGSRAQYLQPALLDEVQLWLDTRAEDAVHVRRADIGGRTLEVALDGERRRLVKGS
jgi:hypothetical protein